MRKFCLFFALFLAPFAAATDLFLASFSAAMDLSAAPDMRLSAPSAHSSEAVSGTAAARSGSIDRAFPEHFGQWAASTPATKSKDDENAAVLTESGLLASFTRQYSNGAQTVVVGLTQFRDPSGAYEAYTAQFKPDMHPSTVGDPSAIDHDRLLMLIGNIVLRVQQPQFPSTAELQELAGAVRKYADATPLPPVRTYLPSGFADGTQRYALGPAGFQNAFTSMQRNEYVALSNEVGFSSGAEAMLAEYRTGNGKESAILLLLEYPTPQLAEQHLHHLESTMPAAANRESAKFERRGSLLSVALAATSPAYAARLRSAVNYQTQVTWNEPSHTLTDPPWLLILKNIFIGTVFFCLMAVALGIAFGGVRIITKRLFPGKVFDRKEQVEVLQLGLSGKRIDPTDFY